MSMMLRRRFLALAREVWVTVTGAVATFTTLLAAPLKELIVSIDDANGVSSVTVYDDPYYGGLVDFNQRCPTTGTTSTGGGVTYTNNGNGSWTLTNNGTGTNRKQIATMSSIATNDIIFFTHGADAVGSSTTFYVCFTINGAYITDVRAKKGMLIKAAYPFNQFSIRTFASFRPPDGGLVLWPQWFNLTQMFGATKANEIFAMEQNQAGSGIAYFRSLFPENYYPYSTGTQTTVGAVNNNPGNSVTVSIPTPPGTVTSGILDVIHGVLTVGGTDYPVTSGQLSTLIGNNNVFSNAGDITITYQSN